MKQVLFAALTFTILISACKKGHTDNVSVIKNGTYAGTFQRRVSGSGPISNVTITFNSGNWTGQSQYSKYPALCHGTYKTTATDYITFENLCPWTAEFDWTLILSGDYNLTASGNNLEISKDYNGAFKDIYALKKQ
jgi:hypothetical protein